MEEEYIDNSIAESVRSIIELCFSHTECGGCPLYNGEKKACQLQSVPSGWNKPEREGDHYVFK